MSSESGNSVTNYYEYNEMINAKSFSVIDADKLKGNIHIVGIGATGSMIAEHLVRLNLGSKLFVYDDDVVEAKNINNQAYLDKHIGMPKVEAFKDLARMIDPECEVKGKDKRVSSLDVVSNDDIVILTVDNFSSRASILKSLYGVNPLVITGGVSSIGGNVEFTRGEKNISDLADYYAGIPDGEEYDATDLTPCGSPISIYHRLRVFASLATEGIIKYRNKEELKKNLSFDVPNTFFIWD